MESACISKEPFLSVIVPFYNIEECVSYCLGSLLAQTYTNYEVICVDDGSVDDTLARLRLCEQKNSRVRVVSVKNGGLSYARNCGVQAAAGELITFVDGDDVVAPKYLERLVSALIGTGSDMVIARMKSIAAVEHPFSSIVWECDELPFRKLARNDVIDTMLYENPMISSCAHLAPKSVYLRAPFEEGKLFEDTLAFEEHVLWARYVAFVDDPLYGYVKRRGSITNLSSVSEYKVQSFIDMVIRLDKVIRSYGETHQKSLLSHEALELSRLYRMVGRSDCSSDRIESIKQGIQSFYKKNLGMILLDKRVSLVKKCRFSLLFLFPNLYEFVFRKYESR